MTVIRLVRNISGVGVARTNGILGNSVRSRQSQPIWRMGRCYYHDVVLSRGHLFSTTTTTTRETKKTVLVLGSNGALGSCIVSYLKPTCHVIGADVVVPSSSKNEEDAFLSVSSSSNVHGLTKELMDGMQKQQQEKNDLYLDAIICASGGFAMDDDDNGDMDMDVVTQMMELNYYPVVAAAQLAKTFMAPKGLFVVMGAAAALVPGPGVGAYCASKAAAHYYVQTLGAKSGVSLGHKTKEYFPDEPYLDELTAVAILPTILDTPTNRQLLMDNNGDDDDDHSWIPLPDIAQQIQLWIDQPFHRPHSGSLIKATKQTPQRTTFQTTNSTTTMFTLVQ